MLGSFTKYALKGKQKIRALHAPFVQDQSVLNLGASGRKTPNPYPYIGFVESRQFTIKYILLINGLSNRNSSFVNRGLDFLPLQQ